MVYTISDAAHRPQDGWTGARVQHVSARGRCAVSRILQRTDTRCTRVQHVSAPDGVQYLGYCTRLTRAVHMYNTCQPAGSVQYLGYCTRLTRAVHMYSTCQPAGGVQYLAVSGRFRMPACENWSHSKTCSFGRFRMPACKNWSYSQTRSFGVFLHAGMREWVVFKDLQFRGYFACPHAKKSRCQKNANYFRPILACMRESISHESMRE
jgi:hypothetical protein